MHHNKIIIVFFMLQPLLIPSSHKIVNSYHLPFLNLIGHRKEKLETDQCMFDWSFFLSLLFLEALASLGVYARDSVSILDDCVNFFVMK